MTRQPLPTPRIWAWWRSRLPALVLFLGVAGLSLNLTGCLRVSSDTAALRDGVLAALPDDWSTQFEIGVGWVTMTAARAGLSFVDLPPEARSAIQAFSGADVGIYRCTHSAGKIRDLGSVIQAADGALTKRGWDRLVTVRQAREIVAVFVPQTMPSSRQMKACVLVIQPRQMVVVSAQGDLQRLMGLAFPSTYPATVSPPTLAKAE